VSGRQPAAESHATLVACCNRPVAYSTSKAFSDTLYSAEGGPAPEPGRVAPPWNQQQGTLHTERGSGGFSGMMTTEFVPPCGFGTDSAEFGSGVQIPSDTNKYSWRPGGKARSFTQRPSPEAIMGNVVGCQSLKVPARKTSRASGQNSSKRVTRAGATAGVLLPEIVFFMGCQIVRGCRTSSMLMLMAGRAGIVAAATAVGCVAASHEHGPGQNHHEGGQLDKNAMRSVGWFHVL